MTIAISLKVNDGLVLAADSASTLIQQSESGVSVVNVYNHANKISNLRKGFPIGAVTWGAGSIGSSSISTLLKDFRDRLTRKTDEWHLNDDGWSVEEVATRLRTFIYEDRYVPFYGEIEPQDQPALGFVVGGYTPGAEMAAEYQILVRDGECPAPERLRESVENGLTWNGEPDAITRQLVGFDPKLTGILSEDLGVDAEMAANVTQVIRGKTELFLVYDAMPIQDAIDLAEFLVDLTIRVSRFAPGASTVGGEIEIAAITKHEGFKWVKRKHYFDNHLNPERSHA